MSGCLFSSYEVGQEASVRYEFSKDGRKKTIKIDLPAGTVGEMVENELSKKLARLLSALFERSQTSPPSF